MQYNGIDIVILWDQNLLGVGNAIVRAIDWNQDETFQSVGLESHTVIEAVNN
jgi:hypothetical protein